MDWTQALDVYCERADPGYWAEPINALTNAAFVIAALVMWPRSAGLPLARALCVVLGLIGVGSFLFHTHATAWAATADITPIAVFVLLYLYAANRHFWNLPLWAALLGTAAFVPWAMLLTPLFERLPFFAVSAFYWPVPTLIALYGVALAGPAPETARGLGLGAALLVASLAARSADGALCPVMPWGTHFLWHLLNAVMLSWMIEVYRRHRLEGGRARR